jgi:hypothetical protein
MEMRVVELTQEFKTGGYIYRITQCDDGVYVKRYKDDGEKPRWSHSQLTHFYDAKTGEWITSGQVYFRDIMFKTMEEALATV